MNGDHVSIVQYYQEAFKHMPAKMNGSHLSIVQYCQWAYKHMLAVAPVCAESKINGHICFTIRCTGHDNEWFSVQ